MQPDDATIKETVLSNSTYAFELEVLSQLEGNGITCVHNGAYRDLITNKFREFDIYGYCHFAENDKAFTHHIAVECKRIDQESPLVVLGSRVATNAPFWPSPVYSLSGDNGERCPR